MTSPYKGLYLQCFEYIKEKFYLFNSIFLLTFLVRDKFLSEHDFSPAKADKKNLFNLTTILNLN